MTNLEFEPIARKQMEFWKKQDKKTLNKILKLIDDIYQTPFSGIGKPEPLKHNYAGCWSRRITAEHRLVYRIEGETVIVLSCRFHYD